MKVCKTCQFWSTEKKGLCRYDNRGVGQFWTCEHWQTKTPGGAAEKAAADSCRICATQPR